MNDYMNYFNYNYINNFNDNGNMTSKAGFKKNVSNNIGYNTDPYEGFIKGNMFSKLYTPYKNYKPLEVNPSNEKDYALFLVQMYGFAAHDLGLYLDVTPNDDNAIRLRSEYVNLYNQSLAQYENKYGALTSNSVMLDATPWAWDSKKWPWEGNK